MDPTPNTAFTPGEGLVHTAIENGFAAKRGVEFLSISNGGQHAQVKWAGEIHNVLLTELSRPQAPTHPPYMSGWLTTPKPPQPPTPQQLDVSLTAARAELQRSHTHAKQRHSAVEQARQIALRAGKECEQARAALATLDRHDAASLADLELALRENREAPPIRNGVDRNYVRQHLDRAEAASTKLSSELAAAQAALGDALSSVRAKARAVLSVIFARECELLRQAELRCALTRSELTKISQWWPTAEGHLTLPPATGNFIAQQPHWADLPEIRQASGHLSPWQRLHSRLVDGEALADFSLED